MNVRKPTDYSALFTGLDVLMAADLPQMELYRSIGRLVCGRPEKGAAVAAAEHLQGTYPDATGFSPRNLRRMRNFYRTYENVLEITEAALTIGWTQNVVILEAELTLQEKAWYIQAVHQFGWAKLALIEQIKSSAHLEIALDLADEVCHAEENNTTEFANDDENSFRLLREYPPQHRGRVHNEGLGEKAGLETQLCIESAATSTVEIGALVHPAVHRKLAEHGIDCAGETARQFTNLDYDKYDLLIGMDRTNLRDMHHICGGDYDGRLHLLTDYSSHPSSAARKKTLDECSGVFPMIAMPFFLHPHIDTSLVIIQNADVKLVAPNRPVRVLLLDVRPDPIHFILPSPIDGIERRRPFRGGKLLNLALDHAKTVLLQKDGCIRPAVLLCPGAAFRIPQSQILNLFRGFIG